MPMTSAVAPKFSAAHPRAAVIFDNLHMMHDIISDILQNDTVPAAKKREVIYAALDEFQDPTRNVISMDMWRNMADHMGGVAAMGGPATGILRPIAATATHPGHAAGGHDAAAHGASGARDTNRPHHPTGHRPEPAGAQDDAHARRGEDDVAADGAARRAGSVPHAAPHADRMMELHMRMMQDTVIRRRVMADSVMRRTMAEMMADMPAEHRAHMQQMMQEAPTRTMPSQPAAEGRPQARPVRPARPARPATPKRPAPRAAPDGATGHEGHRPPSRGRAP
jgi:hypothetical protein